MGYRTLVANLPDTVVTLFDPDLRIVVAEGALLARRGLDADTPDAASPTACMRALIEDDVGHISAAPREQGFTLQAARA